MLFQNFKEGWLWLSQLVVIKWYGKMQICVDFILINQFLGSQVGSFKTNIPIKLHSKGPKSHLLLLQLCCFIFNSSFKKNVPAEIWSLPKFCIRKMICSPTLFKKQPYVIWISLNSMTCNAKDYLKVSWKSLTHNEMADG